MNTARPAVTLACVLAALACSNPTNPNPPLPPSGNGGFGVGVGGTGGMPATGNIVIEIQEPTPDIIAPGGSLVDVRAHVYVDQGTDFIEPTSVEATVMSASDTAELESTKLAPQTGDIFSGRISLGDRPTGNYVLTVSATSSSGQKNSVPINFQIDAGPILLVRSPLPLHAYKGLLVIEVLADAGIFPALDGPYATIANYPVPLTPVVDPSGNPVPNLFRGMFNLRDPNPPMILPPLRDAQLLTVSATNGNLKRNEQHVVFFIDEEGPQITRTSPAPGEIVGDVMRISATVLDPSGVLDASVIAVIGDDTTPAKFNVQLKPDGAGVYSIFFDTRKLTGCNDPPNAADLCIVYPTISFRASDELGNERAIGYNFTVDNIAPVADLDPPKLRSYRIEETIVCSWEFDPLSNNRIPGDMPNDTNRAPQVFDLRARIQDDGNHANGLKQTPISLVDPDKTAVYVLDDENQALIVDTDGDGWCDSINPLLTPTTEPPTDNNQVLKVRLAPVPPAGVANFRPDPSLPNAFCQPGLAPTLPPLLCGGSQPTIAIGYTGEAHEPAIWSLEDIDVSWCFGKPFDAFANNIKDDSWACFAVATADFANNFSVSAPLRLYIDYQMPLNQFLTSGPGTPPACTGTYDRATKTVSNGPCRTRRFEQRSNADLYCYNRECFGPPLPL